MRIVKMSGSGNDFVVLGPEEARLLGGRLVKWVRAICRRRLSVGADGVLVVEPVDGTTVAVRFYNPDGTEAFCGNGMRCAARFAFASGHALRSMTLATCEGDVHADIKGDCVYLSLPVPVDRGRMTIRTGAGELSGRRIDSGAPHFVVRAPSPNDFPLEEWGPLARNHPDFGQRGTNLDVVSEHSSGQLDIRTWERGVEGETLACGTGALAAASAASIETGGDCFEIIPRSKIPITIRFHGPLEKPEYVTMRGDARMVFSGTLGPDALSGIPKGRDSRCADDQ